MTKNIRKRYDPRDQFLPSADMISSILESIAQHYIILLLDRVEDLLDIGYYAFV